jgi:hypothetical protein
MASALDRPLVKTLVRLALLLLFPLAGCGTFLEDNGTHLAYALEKGAGKLKASGANELVVHYTTLDAEDRSYYVELAPSLDASRPADKVWSSYLVVSGKTSGGTSYHNRFVFVPQRLYVEKSQGGATDLVLRKVGTEIHVVEIR